MDGYQQMGEGTHGERLGRVLGCGGTPRRGHPGRDDVVERPLDVQLLEVPPQHPGLLGGAGHVQVEQARLVGMRLDPVPDRAGDPTQRGDVAWFVVGPCLRDDGVGRAHDPPQGDVEELLLAGEVVIHRCGNDLRRLGDILDAGRVEALTGENPDGGGDDQLALGGTVRGLPAPLRQLRKLRHREPPDLMPHRPDHDDPTDPGAPGAASRLGESASHD